MSYILDALKKSEKERQRGTLPDMLTVQDIVAEKPRKSLVWVYLLGVVLSVNAGMMVWWLGSTHSEKAKAVQPATAQNIVASPTNPAAPESTAKAKLFSDSQQSISPEPRSADKNAIFVTENTGSGTSDKNSLRPKSVQKVQDVQRKILYNPAPVNDNIKLSEPAAKMNQAAGADRFSPGPTSDSAELLDENKLYRFKELPLSFRQSLPPFSVSALLYSDNPASRMARINEQMMYEGQELTAGLKVEEITKDGIIFSHQKIRFRVDVK
jgi:general secretion pathway protein B